MTQAGDPNICVTAANTATLACKLTPQNNFQSPLNIATVLEFPDKLILYSLLPLNKRHTNCCARYTYVSTIKLSQITFSSGLASILLFLLAGEFLTLRRKFSCHCKFYWGEPISTTIRQTCVQIMSLANTKRITGKSAQVCLARSVRL